MGAQPQLAQLISNVLFQVARTSRSERREKRIIILNSTKTLPMVRLAYPTSRLFPCLCPGVRCAKSGLRFRIVTFYNSYDTSLRSF